MSNDIYGVFTEEELKNEVWRDVVGYVGLYQVSNLGRVKSLNYRRTNTPKILKPGKNSSGYLDVGLYDNGSKKSMLIHRLVGFAFIPKLKDKPAINHKNGCKTDNKVDNLEWVSPSENNFHAIETGLRNIVGENHGRCKLTDVEVAEIRKLYSQGGYVQRELAEMYGVAGSHVSEIVNYQTRKSPTPVLEKH